METFTDRNVARTTQRVVQEELRKHSSEVCVEAGTRFLLKARKQSSVLLQMSSAGCIVEFRQRGPKARYMVHTIRQDEVKIGGVSQEDVGKLLGTISTYKPCGSLYTPYGYMEDGRITAIFVREANSYRGWQVNQYVLKGAMLPEDDLFTPDKLTFEKWGERLYRLLRNRVVVNLREGQQEALKCPTGKGALLDRTLFTSNVELLGDGEYRLDNTSGTWW